MDRVQEDHPNTNEMLLPRNKHTIMRIQLLPDPPTPITVLHLQTFQNTDRLMNAFLLGL
jgi:hypothetical protein